MIHGHSVVRRLLCVMLPLLACTPSASVSRSSGSMALSLDDAYLYAADTDNGVVVVVDAKRQEPVAQVKVGLAPTRLLVGPDESLYVTNRGARSVSVIRKGVWTEAARLDVGVEPAGLALSRDGQTLLVVSSTSLDTPEVGTLTAFDTATLQRRWELPVGEEPRAVAALSGDRAIVSLFKRGEIVTVDLTSASVTRASLGLHAAANRSSSGSASTFAPRAVSDLVVTPDGTRAFAPLVWARVDAITIAPTTSGGYYGGGGPCNIGSVASPGLVTLDAKGSSVEPLVDDLTSCTASAASTADYPTSLLYSRSFSVADALQGPTVGVLDATGSWLYVVNCESHNVAVVPAYRRDGPRPRGLREGHLRELPPG